MEKIVVARVWNASGLLGSAVKETHIILDFMEIEV